MHIRVRSGLVGLVRISDGIKHAHELPAVFEVNFNRIFLGSCV